jgi:hypothetical protein
MVFICAVIHTYEYIHQLYNTYIQITFLPIVMKVAFFYRQNRSESITFLHEKS